MNDDNLAVHPDCFIYWVLIKLVNKALGRVL